MNDASPPVAASNPDGQPADDLAVAKQQLLSYAQRPNEPNIIQRHPGLAAGVALVVGVLVVRLPVSRVLLRAGATLALREAGRSFAKSVGRRV